MNTTSETSPPSSSPDLRALLREAEQALGDAAGEGGEKIEELRNRLRSALDNGAHLMERWRSEAIRQAKQADQLVRDNPYYAIGIAAGVGALIGILVSRSCSSSR